MQGKIWSQDISDTPLFLDDWPGCSELHLKAVTVSELEDYLRPLFEEVRETGEPRRAMISFAAPPGEGERIRRAFSASIGKMIVWMSLVPHVTAYVGRLHEPEVKQQLLELSGMKLYSFKLTIEKLVLRFDPPPTAETKEYRSFNEKVRELRNEAETLGREIAGLTKEIREEGAWFLET
jgi:hypothetical protein